MSLSVKYDYPEGAVALYLYMQTGSEITMDALPSGKITLSKDDNEYLVDSPVEGEHYSFIIESVDDNGFNNFSPIQNIIYIRDTGPGNNTVKRGRFDFGVMDELSNEEFGLSANAVRNHFSLKLPGIYNYSIEMDGWYKCIVDGRIIFIPKSTSAKSYGRGPGLEFGRSINDATIRSRMIDSGLYYVKDDAWHVDTDNIININGNEFRWRSIKSWTGGDTVPGANSFDDKRSELAMLQCLSSPMHPGTNTELQIPVQTTYSHDMSIGENYLYIYTSSYYSHYMGVGPGTSGSVRRCVRNIGGVISVLDGINSTSSYYYHSAVAVLEYLP